MTGCCAAGSCCGPDKAWYFLYADQYPDGGYGAPQSACGNWTQAGPYSTGCPGMIASTATACTQCETQPGQRCDCNCGIYPLTYPWAGGQGRNLAFQGVPSTNAGGKIWSGTVSFRVVPCSLVDGGLPGCPH